MASMIDVIRMNHPDEIPCNIGVLPIVWKEHGKEMQRVADEYPQFFHGQKFDWTEMRKTLRPGYLEGFHTDVWGCVWENHKEGMESYCTGHPIQSDEDILALQIPKNDQGRLPHGFMYLKLLDLCGFEYAMTLFADPDEEEILYTLLNKVTEYNLTQVDIMARRNRELFNFADDLGMQNGLAVGPEKWRKYLKPCFAKIYGRLKELKPGVLIYMHTDGCIYEIMPDLVEAGVDMINPQFRANGLDNLERVCRKERMIAIDLDLDRQMFPFATRSQIFDHVAECVETLWRPEGGLSLHIEIGEDVTPECAANIFDALEKYRFYKG